MGGCCCSGKTEEEDDHQGSEFRTYTAAEFEENFDIEYQLGTGRSARVYRATLKSMNKAVAIKRSLEPSNRQRQNELLGEAEKLGKLDHPNIVKVIGFFVAAGDLVHIIYDRVARGSLQSHLYRSTSPLDWAKRKKILLGVARGLKYLHDQDPPVIHDNLRSSNVLLGLNYEALLSDIGMVGNLGKSVSMPEYPEMGRSTVESDIYAFGLLLLEIITGKRAIGSNASTSSSSQPQNLVAWAEPFLKDKEKVTEMADLFMMGRLKESEFCEAAYLAAACLEEDASRRPHMDEIIKSLTHAWEISG